MKTFLISISIISLLCSSAFAVDVDPKDLIQLRSDYTQYKNSYNRTLQQVQVLTNAYGNQIRYQDKLISIWSNEWKKKDKEVKEIRTQNTIYLILLGIIDAVAIYGIIKGAAK